MVFMNLRNLCGLENTKEFTSFINKYCFKVKNIENIIYLKNNYILIEIYSYSVEPICYFNFYNLEFSYCVSIDFLLKDIDKNVIFKIKNDIDHSHKVSILSHPLGNHQNSILAERNFYFYLKLIDVFLADLIINKSQLNFDKFKIASEFKKDFLSNLSFN